MSYYITSIIVFTFEYYLFSLYFYTIISNDSGCLAMTCFADNVPEDRNEICFIRMTKLFCSNSDAIRFPQGTTPNVEEGATGYTPSWETKVLCVFI